MFPVISVAMNGKDRHRLKLEKESPLTLLCLVLPDEKVFCTYRH